MNMGHGLRIDILVKFNYQKDIYSSFQGVGENGYKGKLQFMQEIRHVTQIWKNRD
jgi:hypothetical protein